MQLCFATNNDHKLVEIRSLLGKDFSILSLKEIGCNEEIPEEGQTLEENSAQKARFIYERYGLDCFADDTGLEVEALGGEPGVYSARYAGPGKSSEDNMTRLLDRLIGQTNREARFRTVITLILNGREYKFEGVANGRIIEERKGGKGFGYDPVFQPEGFDKTFAEMTLKEKGEISHRGQAIRRLAGFLKQMA